MKERPILFSGPMVRAVLAGHKTQTRRVVKQVWLFNPLQARLTADGGLEALVSAEECRRVGVEPLHIGPHWHRVSGVNERVATCPYGAPGDQLWVRESFSAWFQGIHWYSYRGIRDDCAASNVFYRATHPYPDDDQKWIPSIHMPRWASRLKLEITGVRVERLQEISEDDAIAEGLIKLPATGRAVLNKGAQYFGDCWPSVRAGFRDLWDQLNAKRGFDWDTNPWVWVLEFRRLGT